MRAHKAAIAGSFVVQAILGKEWRDAEIDLWIPERSGSSRRDAMEALSRVIPNLGLHLTREDLQGYFPTSHYATKVYSYTDSRLGRLRIMFVKEPYTVAHVVQSFDIVATQVLWDGTKVMLVNPDALTQLRAGLIMFSQIATQLQSAQEWIQTIKSVRNYIGRGFKLGPHELAVANSCMMHQLAKAASVTERETLTRQWNLFVSQIAAGSPHRVPPRNASRGRIPHQRPEPTPLVEHDDDAPGRCYDYTSYYDIKGWLAHSESNLVIFENYTGSAQQPQAVCTSKEILQNGLRDPSRNVFACKPGPTNGSWAPERRTAMVSLPLTINPLVAKTAVESALRSSHQLFEIRPAVSSSGSQVTIGRTVTSAAIDNGGVVRAVVGAHHCQEGTDKKLYNLVPVRLPNS